MVQEQTVGEKVTHALPDNESCLERSSSACPTQRSALSGTNSSVSNTTCHSTKFFEEEEFCLKTGPMRANSGAARDTELASAQRMSAIYVRRYPFNLHFSILENYPGRITSPCQCHCHRSSFSDSAVDVSKFNTGISWPSTNKMFHSDVSLSRTQSEIVTGEVSSIALPSRHLASVTNANNNHNEKSPQASQNPNCHVTTHLQQVAECHAEVFEVEDCSDHTYDSVSCSPDGVGSKRPGCFKNYGLMGLVILLIVVTVATLSALVYFVVFGNRSRVDGVTATTAKQVTTSTIPYVTTLLNQTLHCGRLPKSYIPGTVDVRSRFTSASSEPSRSRNGSRIRIRGRIVGAQPANIMQYPWQNFNHTSSDVNVPATTVDAGNASPLHVVSPRVMGGNVAKVSWQVSLFIEGKGMRCGGSIILNNWVVTAAHCTQEEPETSGWIVYAGISALSKRNEFPAQMRKISRIVQHPNYVNDMSYDYDISLMKLSKKLTFSSAIQPICIPPQGYTFQPGRSCFVSGWGAISGDGIASHPDVLQHVEIDVIADNKCNSSDWYAGLLTKRMVCAGKEQGQRDACQGDSGGPLSCYMPNERIWMLAGSVSWGIGCGLPKQPGVYTRVSFFSDWIWKNIGEDEGWIPKHQGASTISPS